ncbi:family 16 glycosylhydrolase [Chitinophaga filiformis]|uniref:Glycoside hydrolase family 16 protein n=1 Tax=Chitinophaga filiformis TaxID=104663 RepID=A0ABY4I118_CHIFI|nr:glycoside hydrolase family 16 protein [Chitinophaga filiformis]UPK69784.1 glycoside hydrolase family 16 protein [Chitinophaga filiformis]
MRKTQLLSYCLLAIVGITACSKKNDESPKLNNETALAAAEPPTVQVPGVCEYDLDEAALKAQGYTKVFEDNFNTLDTTKWDRWNSGGYNNELQLYTPKNLRIVDGKLLIKPVKETVTGATDPDDPTKKKFDFTSGRIESHYNFKASTTTPKVRISARIKQPLGFGMWPAFWSYGGNWPTNGELDILEGFGERNLYNTNIWYGSTAGTPDHDYTLSMTYVQSQSDLTSCYHVYEAIWQKDTVTFLLDGTVTRKLVSSTPAGRFIPKFFNKTQHITLNAAIGGDQFGTIDPSQVVLGDTYVDWVRVYTAK